MRILDNIGKEEILPQKIVPSKKIDHAAADPLPSFSILAVSAPEDFSLQNPRGISFAAHLTQSERREILDDLDFWDRVDARANPEDDPGNSADDSPDAPGADSSPWPTAARQSDRLPAPSPQNASQEAEAGSKAFALPTPADGGRGAAVAAGSKIPKIPRLPKIPSFRYESPEIPF